MPGRPLPPTMLDTRALSRATLARQMLLKREDRPPFEVIEHLVGMQSQVPRDPYVALWSRLSTFDPADVETLMNSRRVARAPLMRGTIHLVTARDCVALRPPMQPVLTRAQKSAFGKRLAGVDLDALARSGEALLGERPMTFAELRRALGSEWEGTDPMGVAYSVSYLVPLVQVPPRGLWHSTGQPTWTTTRAWLGARRRKAANLREVVLRYLAAFGPATVQDVQAWCGLTGLGEVVDALRPRLVSFRGEGRAELFDLPDAPRPDGATPAPVRFLPQYDNVFLGHADRTRIAPEGVGARWAEVATQGAVSPVLVDGFIDGFSRVVSERGDVALRIEPLSAWDRVTRHAVAEEGERLLEFVASTAKTRTVEFSATH